MLEFIKHFACKTTEAIVPEFITLFDADNYLREYNNASSDVEFDMDDDDMYPYEVVSLYNFQFQICGNCDCNHSEDCFHSEKRAWEYYCTCKFCKK